MDLKEWYIWYQNWVKSLQPVILNNNINNNTASSSNNK